MNLSPNIDLSDNRWRSMTMMSTIAAIAANHSFARDDGFGWWAIFPIMWGLFWLTLVIGGFFLLRRRAGGWQPRSSAETVLGERYARGEIDEDEYRDRRTVLRG